MDADQFEVLVAAIISAGAAAGNAKEASHNKAASSIAGDMRYAIKALREYGFTHGTTPVRE